MSEQDNIIEFQELDPENAHACFLCQHLRLDIAEGKKHYCDIQPDIDIKSDLRFLRPNNCKNWFSAWQNDYRKRPDLLRGRFIKKQKDMKKKIYLASSWRNKHQEGILKELRLQGYEVYDFKHPQVGDPGFQWSKIDENWQEWTMEQYRKNLLIDDYAQFGFNRDFDAMKNADICVLLLPCGRSAHLEAGWMKGAGKKVIAFIPPDERIEPELMYGLLDGIVLCIQDLIKELNVSKC